MVEEVSMKDREPALVKLIGDGQRYVVDHATLTDEGWVYALNTDENGEVDERLYFPPSRIDHIARGRPLDEAMEDLEHKGDALDDASSTGVAATSIRGP